MSQKHQNDLQYNCQQKHFQNPLDLQQTQAIIIKLTENFPQLKQQVTKLIKFSKQQQQKIKYLLLQIQNLNQKKNELSIKKNKNNPSVQSNRSQSQSFQTINQSPCSLDEENEKNQDDNAINQLNTQNKLTIHKSGSKQKTEQNNQNFLKKQNSYTLSNSKNSSLVKYKTPKKQAEFQSQLMNQSLVYKGSQISHSFHQNTSIQKEKTTQKKQIKQKQRQKLKLKLRDLIQMFDLTCDFSLKILNKLHNYFIQQNQYFKIKYSDLLLATYGNFKRKSQEMKKDPVKLSNISALISQQISIIFNTIVVFLYKEQIKYKKLKVI